MQTLNNMRGIIGKFSILKLIGLRFCVLQEIISFNMHPPKTTTFFRRRPLICNHFSQFLQFPLSKICHVERQSWTPDEVRIKTKVDWQDEEERLCRIFQQKCVLGQRVEKNESTLLWREKQDFQSNDEIKLDQHIL